MHETEQVFNKLGDEAAHALPNGHAQLDPYLMRSRAEDQRMGLTLVIRPAAQVVQRLGEVINHLRELEPDQYYYTPAMLHSTFLTLIPVSEDFALDQVNMAQYQAVIRETLSGAAPFEVQYRGMVATTAAVIACGYADQVNPLRERLRVRLRQALDLDVDKRYKLLTTHTSFVRYTAPFRHPARFLEALAALRQLELGRTWITEIELTHNDFYMDRVEIMERYKL